MYISVVNLLTRERGAAWEGRCRSKFKFDAEHKKIPMLIMIKARTFFKVFEAQPCAGRSQ